MNYFFTSEFPDAGSGNKLFVYFLGIILSNIHNLPYYHPEIPEMKINENPIKINNLKNYTTNVLSTLFNSKFIDKNLNYNILYTFTPTIEKYDFFKNYINLCKNSYPIKKKKKYFQ